MTRSTGRLGEAAFEEFYRTHHAHVRAYACRRTDPATAGDVVGETFLTAWRRFDEASRVGLPWLYATARLVLMNLQRSAARQRRVADRVAALPEASAVEDGPVSSQARVRSALASLSSGDQEILMLVHWEELDTAVVAEVLECSRPTAAVRLHRARSRLKRVLQAEDSGGDPDRDFCEVSR